MSEFDLIQRYFNRATPNAALGVGDDAALLRVPGGMELAASTDMLVSGTHFLPDDDPFLLGHKALAVNLSDMAAMGALPRWALLSLALPQADEAWLQQFSDGFFALARQHGVELVGGDTTRGPLNLCVTIMGEVPPGMALRRSGARVGDDVWVSGTLGDAALALAHLQGKVQLSAADFSSCARALHQPAPRVELGLALRGVASGAIDISDGLLADLGHLLECSKVGAEIRLDALPLSGVLRSLPMNLKPGRVGCGDEGTASFASLTSILSRSPKSFWPGTRERRRSFFPPPGGSLKGGAVRGLTTSYGSVLRSGSWSQFGRKIGDCGLSPNPSPASAGECSLARRCILAGGDDYELCFTAPPALRSVVEDISRQVNLPLARIGAIVSGSGCIVRAADGGVIHIGESGYDHFA